MTVVEMQPRLYILQGPVTDFREVTLSDLEKLLSADDLRKARGLKVGETAAVGSKWVKRVD